MKEKIPGVIACVLLAVISIFLARYVLIGGVTVAILLGVLIGNLVKLPGAVCSGIIFAEKIILTWAIALMGFGLNYGVLAHVGIPALAVIICGLFLTIGLSKILGHAFGLDRDLALLVGIGNAVCGSSAIAAAQGVIKTKDEHVGVSIGVINLLGTVGIFLLPLLISALPFLNADTSGVLIGNTLQAIGQVTAAGFSMGADVGKTATIVKMGRILMITPIVIMLNLRRNGGSKEALRLPKIPAYILAFIGFSLVASLGFLPKPAVSAFTNTSEFLLVTAMVGVGMGISFKSLISAGKKALLVGALTSAGQIAFSAGLLLILGKVFA